MEKLTQNINFRVSAQTKAQLIEEAESKDMSLSEYLNLLVANYQNMCKEVQELRKSPIDRASDIVVSYTRDREKEIREQAINQYLLDNDFTESALVSQLKEKIEKIESKELKKLFNQVKGKIVTIGNREQTVVEIPDLINILVKSFKIETNRNN